MDNNKIQELALAHGFKLKEQPNGEMALNPYVFDFAKALISAAFKDKKGIHIDQFDDTEVPDVHDRGDDSFPCSNNIIFMTLAGEIFEGWYFLDDEQHEYYFNSNYGDEKFDEEYIKRWSYLLDKNGQQYYSLENDVDESEGIF